MPLSQSPWRPRDCSARGRCRAAAEPLFVELDVPDEVWNARTNPAAHQLPNTWDAVPAGHGSVSVGSKWLRSQASAVLQVPSVIVPEELWCW